MTLRSDEPARMANEVRQAGAGIDSLIPKFFIRLFAQKSIFFVSFVYFSLLLQTSVYAQEECGTPDLLGQDMMEYLEDIAPFTFMVASALETEYEIPLHFIFVNNDEGVPPFNYPLERMQQAMLEANIHFEGLMSFYLCQVTNVNDSDWYDDPVTHGNIRNQLFPLYNVDDAINVYIIKDLANYGGYTYRLLSGVENAGVIVDNYLFETFSHELGHYFGLNHTFASTSNSSEVFLQPDNSHNYYSDWNLSGCLCCPDCFIGGLQFDCTNVNCNMPCSCDATNSGDRISDTPVDPGTFYCSTSPCPLEFTSQTGQVVTLVYTPDITNLMSYYQGSRDNFSPEQRDRILHTLMTYGADLMANDGSGCDSFEIPTYIANGYIYRPVYDEQLGQYTYKPLPSYRMMLTDLSNSQNYTAITDFDGEYSPNSVFYLAEDKNVKFGQNASLNNSVFDANEGVSAFDLIQINKHILGLEALKSPYGLLAADVNNTGSITTLDQVAIHKVILGIELNYPFVPRFRLFPNYALKEEWDFEEPFTLNPFSASWSGVNGEVRPYLANSANGIKSYLDDYTLHLLNPDATMTETWSCYAIKSGDVNTDFDPNGAAPPPNYSLTAQSHNSISAGQAFTLTFIIVGQNFNFDGYQMGLNIDDDALEVKGVSQGDLTPFGHDYFSVKENQDLAILWYNQSVNPVSVSAASGKKLFKLHLVAERQISASEIGQLILLSSETLPTLVYGNGVKEEIYPVLFRMVVGTETPKIQAQSPYPNPTSQSITLPFTSTEAGTVNAEAFDLFGHVVTISAYYAAGNHSVVMNNLSTLQSGVVYYKLSLNGSVAAGSFIKQ